MSQRVLLFTSSLPETRQEIDALGGHILHEFTEFVVVAWLPEEVDPEALTTTQTTPPEELDSASRSWVRAWWNYETEAAAASELPAIEAANPALAPDQEMPRNADNDPILAEQVERLRKAFGMEGPGYVSSAYMLGRVAVGVVIVPGTAPNLGFQTAEIQKVYDQIVKGTDWLSQQAPAASITWVYDTPTIQPVTATPCSNPSDDTYEQCEAPWRDAALAQMKFSSGLNGIQSYVYQLIVDKQTDWGIAAFFTKYPLHSFAYASGPRLCMQYANDGWGPDNIYRVFAHEVCHLFGAGDEYNNLDPKVMYKCSCDAAGYLAVPNLNCVNCTTTALSCLMHQKSDKNPLEMCDWTRGQVGWWIPDGLMMVHEGAGETGNMRYTIWGQSQGKAASKWSADFPAGQPDILRTTGGPGLALYRGLIHAVFQDAGDNGWLMWATFDGYNWSEQQGLGVCMSRSPTLIEFQGKLYCMYEGPGENGQLRYISYDGSSWSGEQQIPHVTTTGAPGLAVFQGGHLWVVYQEGGATGSVNLVRSTDGQGWSFPGNNPLPGVGITGSPALAVYKNTLYCIHEDASNTNVLKYFSYDEAGNLTQDQPVQNVVGTVGTPALAVGADGLLYCVHQGPPVTHGQAYYFAWDGGSQWSGDKAIPNVRVSRSPGLIRMKLKWTQTRQRVGERAAVAEPAPGIPLP